VFPRDPNEPRIIAWVRNPGVRRTLILGFLWLCIVGVLVRFREVLLPFGLAVLIAFIIEPAVTRVSAWSVAGRPIPRVAVVLAIYALFVGAIVLFVVAGLPQIGHELARIGKEAATVIGDLDGYTALVVDHIAALAAQSNIPLDRGDVERLVADNTASGVQAVKDNASHIFSVGSRVIATLVQAIFGSFLVLMLTAFLSMDTARIQRFAASMVPPEYLWSYTDIVRNITRGLAGVVRGQVMICLTNGVLTFIGLWLLDVRFPLVLALIATVFSLIPIFGSIISTLPIVAVALTESFAKGVFALLWIIGIHLVEANLLNPKIMGDAAKIHPVVVVFVLIAGERTGGLIGALFAVPIASVLLAFFGFLLGRARAAGQVADGLRTSVSVPPEARVEPAPSANPSVP
jgi:predicted PurR-regulated permease PerM